MAPHSGGGGAPDDSDDDDDIVLGVQEDFRKQIDALKRACVLEVGHGGYLSTPASILPADTAAREDEDDEEDDDALLQSIERKFGARFGGDLTPSQEKGFTTVADEEEDENDDEILRSVEALYCKGDSAAQQDVASPRKDENKLGTNESYVPQASSGENAEEACRPDSGDTGSEPTEAVGRSIASFLPGSWTDIDGDFDVELGGTSPGLAPQEVVLTRDHDGSMSSALVETGNVPLSGSREKVSDALKKNRNYQRSLRNVLSQLEVKRNENMELQKRVRALVDFEKHCSRRFSGFFADQANPSVKLIARSPALHFKSSETCDKAVSDIPMCGPPENPDVEKYKHIQEKLSFTFVGRRWSNEERLELAKGVKQQVYEAILRQAMDALSNSEAQPDSLEEHLTRIGQTEFTASETREALPMVNWAEVARVYVVGRTPEDCRSRWMNHEDALIKKSPWTKVEDKRLLRIAQNQDYCHWEQIAQRLGTNRTPAECLIRYQRSLNASIMRRDWTPEEDDQLRAAVEELGEDNWSAVSVCLEGRSNSQCLMRWYKVLHPSKQKRGRWSVEEDKRLKWAVSVYGPKKWRQIAEHVPGRTDLQCRERWCNVLDPSIKLGEWTEEEDKNLEASVSKHGPHHWAAVANDIKIRTDSQCCRRWKALHPENQLAFKRNVHIRRTALAGNFQGRTKERPGLGPQDFTANISLHTNPHGESISPRKRRAARILKRKLARANQSFRGRTSSAPASQIDSASPNVDPAALRTSEQVGEAVVSVLNEQQVEKEHSKCGRSAYLDDTRRRNNKKARMSNPGAMVNHSGKNVRELQPCEAQASSFVDLVRSIQTYCTSSRLALSPEKWPALQRRVESTAEVADVHDSVCPISSSERGNGLPSNFSDGQSILECVTREISLELESEFGAWAMTESGDRHSSCQEDSRQEVQTNGLSQSLTAALRPDGNVAGMENDPVGRAPRADFSIIPPTDNSYQAEPLDENGCASLPNPGNCLHSFDDRLDQSLCAPCPWQQTNGHSVCSAGSPSLDHDNQLSREDEEVAAATRAVLSWPFFHGVQERWSRDMTLLKPKSRKKQAEKVGEGKEILVHCVQSVPVVTRPRSTRLAKRNGTL